MGVAFCFRPHPLPPLRPARLHPAPRATRRRARDRAVPSRCEISSSDASASRSACVTAFHVGQSYIVGRLPIPRGRRTPSCSERPRVAVMVERRDQEPHWYSRPTCPHGRAPCRGDCAVSIRDAACRVDSCADNADRLPRPRRGVWLPTLARFRDAARRDSMPNPRPRRHAAKPARRNRAKRPAVRVTHRIEVEGAFMGTVSELLATLNADPWRRGREFERIRQWHVLRAKLDAWLACTTAIAMTRPGGRSASLPLFADQTACTGSASAYCPRYGLRAAFGAIHDRLNVRARRGG